MTKKIIKKYILRISKYLKTYYNVFKLSSNLDEIISIHRCENWENRLKFYDKDFLKKFFLK